MPNSRGQILLIEDNPGDVKLVKLWLESETQGNKKFDLLCVSMLSDAFPLLQQGGIIAILLDLGLPDGHGLESLTRIYAAAPSIPIVVLSAEKDELLSIQSVQLGAQDFLVKSSISELVLQRSLYYAIERKNLFEHLEYLAHYDVLTGLTNRKLFYDRLKQDILAARRSHKSLALIFLDLDDFKLINDTLGHQSGDDMLKEVGRRLLASIRNTDCAARMGGDEFTLILNNLNNAEDVALIANKVLHALAEPLSLDRQTVNIHASLGIAIFPDDADQLESLIAAADVAMYQAKETEIAGKSNYCFFSAAMGAKIHHDTARYKQLHLAFERNEFELYYQPTVAVESGLIIGMEALLRWQHPEQGLLPPARFMHDLESCGLIVAVGAWVLQQACAQNKYWQQQGYQPMLISVNISARQFRAVGFVDSVILALQKSHLEPCQLELEFHEANLWEDETYSLYTLNQLARLGVKLCVDDFGNDVISAKSLAKFPLHAIKIDQSLMQQSSPLSSEAIIAKAVIEIAGLFHIKGLATGVETESHLDMVRHIACDDAQGYLYGRPLPAGEATELIENNIALNSAIH
jgi:diguanylate cyclase (GGDEF)-like protein